MPNGLVRSGDFRNGTPILLPHQFGNSVSNPEPFGNVNTQSNPTMDSNPVTWLPSPAHFGNQVAFSLQTVPPVVLVPQNAAESVLIPITLLGGFVGSVTFTYSGAPAGITISFAPNPSSTTSTATIIVASTVPVGKYTITITGTSGTAVEYVFSHTVIVTPGTVPSIGDFLLQEDGSSLFELENGLGFILLEV